MTKPLNPKVLFCSFDRLKGPKRSREKVLEEIEEDLSDQNAKKNIEWFK